MAATKVVFWGETAKVVLGMMSKGKSTLNRFRHGPAAAVVALTVAPWAPTLSGVVFASQPASFVGEGALDTSSPTMEPAAESAAMNKLLVGQLLLYHQMMKNLLKVRRYQD